MKIGFEPEKKNAFGNTIYDPRTKVLENPNVRANVEATLDNVLEHLGIDKDMIDIIRPTVMAAVEEDCKLGVYEKALAHILIDSGVSQKIPEKLGNRAGIILGQISEHIEGKDICDYGCGDGKVGELIAEQGYNVSLADIYRHSHIDNIGLPFAEFKVGEPAPFEAESFDTTLLLTVLHHSDKILGTLRDAARITRKGGRIIVIESVYGVDKEIMQSPTPQEEKFLGLTKDEQRFSNIFFDHFYNRAVHYSLEPDKKVPVPYNFWTPDKWRELFKAHDLEQVHLRYLGIDQPVVPEFHTLHVLNKIDNYR